MIRKVTPGFAIGGYHYLLAFAGAVYCGFPSKKLKVIGVTGTNGKSTTVELISAILKENGFKVALSSSIKFEMAGEVRKNTLNNSMPGRFAIQKLLSEAVQKKCDYAIVEVTSEGIKQHRHRFIDFEMAVFTNLTPEHIESHGGFENYRSAKQKLFSATKGIHIVNCDDENAGHFLKFKAKKKICYGLGSGNIEGGGEYEKVTAKDVRSEDGGIGFVVGNSRIKCGLAGQFNAYNCLAAICVAMSQGIDLEICRRALEKVKTIPGRMEKIASAPAIFVDYAFTPNALEKVYTTLRRDLGNGGRMVCLLGACGGGRDKWKRPVLGQIAGRFCDEIVLTDEDPWGEDPMEIVKMIKEGVAKTNFPEAKLHIIMDRRKAINKALSVAGPADTVILTGKGCESWIRLDNGKKIAWDEKKAALEELAAVGR